MDTASSKETNNGPHIPAGTTISGDVFTGGKRVVQTGGGDYFEHVEHYHERRHPPAPRQAPALPSYFQPRPELAEQILAPLSAASQSVVAITGLDGVGKTTLASLVARETAARFSDGILWGELKGQVGEREEMLGSFLDALDIDKDEIRPFDARVKTLRSALNNRRFLLVLDNLSDETLDPSSLLPVTGDICVLVTTTNRDLAATVTDHVVDIPPFSSEVARDLLLKLVGDELLQLPSDLLSNILRQTGGFPLFLVNVGRQGRRLKRRGQKALQQWAANPDIDWGNLASLYEFSYHQLFDPERRALEVIGLLAVAPLNAQLIAAALDIEIAAAQSALEGLEAYSLLDDTEDGDFRIHEAVHHYIQNNLFSISELKTPRKRLTPYLLNWIDAVEETTPTYEANLAHLQALLGHSVQAEDWSLITDFAQVTKRPILIGGGNIRVLYKTQYFLAQFDGIDFSNAMVTKSDLSASLFNGCEFSHSTVGGVHLPGAVFRGCEFTNTHLLDVDLRGAQFDGCNFAGYIFADVVLDGAVFRGCTGIEALNPLPEIKTEER